MLLEIWCLLSDTSWRSLLILLFLPSKIEFSVEQTCRLTLTLSQQSTYLCIQSGLILSLMSTESVRSKNVSEEWLMEGGRSFLMGTEVSSRASYFSVLALQGVLPVSISQQITPKAQMSLLKLYLFQLSASGGMQTGEPTLQEEYLRESECLIAKPKSAILMVLFLRKILAGFKSLWIIPLDWILLQPFITWFINPTASPSDRHLFPAMCLERSPSHSSVMIQVLFLVVYISQRSRMLLMFLSDLSTSISEASRFLWTSLLIFFMSMTFIATGPSGYISAYQ